MSTLNIVILAAGKGTRMHSNQPKVLHQIAHMPILGHVLHSAKQLKPSKLIVVYGFGGEEVKAAYAHENITWVEQTQQLGTGHAVQQALPHLDKDGKTLILLGDVPLIDAQQCQQLINQADDALVLLSFIKQDPTGYGRIVRNQQSAVIAIVEHKDATTLQHSIKEVNSGIMAMPNIHLKKWLSQLNNHNAQQEYYLTDIIGFATNDQVMVEALITEDEWSVTGINSKVDLAQTERVYQNRIAQQLLQQGVTLKDPQRIDIRGKLNCGLDVIIDINCIFEGEVTLEDSVEIGPHCVIKQATIGAGCHIAAFTHIDGANIAQQASIGPFARLRPGTRLAAHTHIGNFVELKNAQVDANSKINHLSYIGDAIVGKNVNIGAGTITCNYDGANKFNTTIEDDVFVGSDTQLIAPVTVCQGATIAAGSTITKNVPAETLAVCRAKEQKNIVGWKRPRKQKPTQ